VRRVYVKVRCGENLRVVMPLKAEILLELDDAADLSPDVRSFARRSCCL